MVKKRKTRAEASTAKPAPEKPAKPVTRAAPPGDRVFDSLSAAAAALNVDKKTLQRAKSAGCPAFRGSRVNERELNHWISANPAALAAPIGASLDDQKTAEQVRKLRLDNDRTEGSLILLAVVEKQVHEVASGLMKILRQKLENEYPAAVAGMDPAQARIYGKRVVDEICAMTGALCESLRKLAESSKLKTN